MLLEEDLSYQIRGAVFEVSRHLGHGFLEKVYERALSSELRSRGLGVASQVSLVVRYKGKDVGRYCADMIVENRILLELKSQAQTKNDEAQMLNYLKASGLRVGMLINFVYPKAQIKRLIT
jgi:GxxExxY protein